uniref:Uncharacterized protein n=1 Tax=Lactuca sativa TaxID=4236 RepID=A0A9R1VID9_LACSA|nr:hypothetical protein LSAT_V11C500230710 [Lactuca sativa]
MADSSSIHDTLVRQPLLTIKPQPNLIIDLTLFIYEPYMMYVVECLKYSPLIDALTKVEVVPMSCLSLVYSTPYYDKVNERIHFELHNEMTSISKHRFCALIGLSQEQSLVNPDSITTGQLFSMFYQMGYTKTLSTITKFKKSCLPPEWNGLFTLLFKGLSERSAGSDGASKSFITVLYGLYHGIDLDYGSIIWQQLVQSLVSSSRHSEISCGRFWSISTNWAMDHLRVPIMVDSLLSSIATFHTTKIIVTYPPRYSFIGSIPEAMLGRISALSNVLQQYRKRPSSGPRELTPAMIRSIKEADKAAKRGKTPDTQKEGPVIKPTKGQTPKKQNDSDTGDTPPRSPTPEIPVRSNPPLPPPITIPVSIPPIFPIPATQPSTTIPIHPPILTDTTTTTTTTGTQFTAPNPPVTKPPVTIDPLATSKPLSPTQSTETTHILCGEDLEFDSTNFSPYRVQSDDDDDEYVIKRHLKAVNEKLDQMLSSSSSGAYFKAALKALFSSVVTEHSATLSAAAKAIEASTSQCQQASLAVDASTKECKEATAKVDKLVSEAHQFLDSLQAAAAKNAQTVNASVENLQRSLQSERSDLEAARQAIEAANETLHANVNDRLTQLEAELALKYRIMYELNRRTSQLKLQTHKLGTANAEVNDLKSEREVIRSSAADVHSILLHLIEAHDPIITITIRRHLADKLRSALDILSCIEGVPMTGVQPKQGGENVTTQPPSGPKSSTEPKGNEASKKIGEEDTYNEDDFYAENPKNPFQKVKTSEKEMEESFKKQRAELEQK